MDRFKTAWIWSLGVPLALIAGALGSQFIGGLYPCEMCHWQRWPHYAAIGLAILALISGKTGVGRLLVALAALAILSSGLIGVFHAGVEYGWWRGITGCSNITHGGNMAEILKAPTISCEHPQWTLGPISLAGFNALISIPAALYILALLARREKSL